jgi:cardiolipin synthase C
LLASLLLALAAAAVVVIVRACHPLPPLAHSGDSAALPDADVARTNLGRALAPLLAEHHGLSGVYPLSNGHDAFAARMRLVQAAERSLDVQYYIWRSDLTGTMLFDALQAAAERGVRVRFLLDDNNTARIEHILVALDAHPNIEVRLFNPVPIRKARPIWYLTDPLRLNRRMHNKSLTADNNATIVGGRNIGDEYFDAAREGELLFVDLDVLAVGPIATDVSTDFNRYWTSASSYPVGQLVGPIDASAAPQVRSAALDVLNISAARAFRDAIDNSSFIADLLRGMLALQWVPARLVSDDPAKGLGRARKDDLVVSKLASALEAAHELDLVSPYFVPSKQGTDAFCAMAKRGVRVRILVNSLESTDLPALHSAYAKRRKTMLEAGVELYEMQLTKPLDERRRRAGPFGSSASTLHAKTFAADRSRIFIGSFNLDQRSANFNTELGFVIESVAVAGRLASMLDDALPAIAYRVQLSQVGGLCWTGMRDGTVVRYDREPGTTFLRRAGVRLLSLLPIDSLL